MSGYDLRVSCWRPTLVPPPNSGANAAPASVQALMLAVLRHITTVIECLTLGLSRGMKKVTLSYCYSGNYPTQGYAKSNGVSALNCIANPKSPTVWACLGVNPLDIPRKTLSITHHALSPHPHVIICTSFTSSLYCDILTY